jgi:hypothetical protein
VEGASGSAAVLLAWASAAVVQRAAEVKRTVRSRLLKYAVVMPSPRLLRTGAGGKVEMDIPKSIQRV